jgi:hypothetical protein
MRLPAAEETRARRATSRLARSSTSAWRGGRTSTAFNTTSSLAALRCENALLPTGAQWAKVRRPEHLRHVVVKLSHPSPPGKMHVVTLQLCA